MCVCMCVGVRARACMPIRFSFTFRRPWPSNHHRGHRVRRGYSPFYVKIIIKRKIKLAKIGVEEARVKERETGKQLEFHFIVGNWKITTF